MLPFNNFVSQSCDSDLSILSLDSQGMVILTQVQITDLGKGKILSVLNHDSVVLYVDTDKLPLGYHCRWYWQVATQKRFIIDQHYLSRNNTLF